MLKRTRVAVFIFALKKRVGAIIRSATPTRIARGQLSWLVLASIVMTMTIFASPHASAVPILDQEQPIIDAPFSLFIGGGSEQKLAQVVTPGISGLLTEVRFPLAIGSGSLLVAIEGVIGGMPDGVVATSQIFPATSLLPPLFPSFESLPFSIPASVLAGDPFAIVLSCAGALGSCEGGLLPGPIGNPYPGGDGFFDSRPNQPGVWVPVSIGTGRFDLPFQTIVEPAAVPEPGSFLLLGSSLAALGAAAWRRHRYK